MTFSRPQELLHFINHTDEDVDCEFSDEVADLLDRDGTDANHGVSADSVQFRKRTHAQAFHAAHHSPQSSSSSQDDGKVSKKLTRGKQKIPIEFIHDRARRYSTFSKRKTGLMKKASELAHLTGAQVLLLIASETKHVYTFATQRLKDIVNLDSGKELIKTCLMGPHRGATEDEAVVKKRAKTASTSDDCGDAHESLSVNPMDSENSQCDALEADDITAGEHCSCTPASGNLGDRSVSSDPFPSSEPVTSAHERSTSEESGPTPLLMTDTRMADHCVTPVNRELSNPPSSSAQALGFSYADARVNSISPLSGPLTRILINGSITSPVDPVQLVLLPHPDPSGIGVMKTDAPVILPGCAVTPAPVPAHPQVMQSDHLHSPQTPIPITPSPCMIVPTPRRTLLPKKPI